MQQEKKQCYFCTTNRDVVDYKDAETLKRFLSASAKIYPRKKSGLCARHQRKLSTAVKRSRYLSFIPFTTR